MARVAIVTDSTAYLPKDVIGSNPLSVLPLQCIFGEEIYRDGVDITPTQFYTRLKTSKVMPTTSQVTPVQFQDTYSHLLNEGYDILSLHISSKLSGTIDSAVQARNMFPGARIDIVDSLSAGMGLGFMALTVARAAAQGASLAECHSLAEHAIEHTGVLFLVDTLEFLHRGGRIGGAAAFLGTMLNMKPILELRNGKIEAVERVRTMGKAVDRLIALAENRIGSRRPVRLATLHANSYENAQLLLDRTRERFQVSEVSETILTDVSPVIGTHTGPGALGLCFMAGM